MTPSAHEKHEIPTGLEDDPEGARLVAEELRLLETVCRATHDAETKRARGEVAGDDERMLELRDDVATAKPEDLPALFEQMHTLGALRAQRGKGVTGTLDKDTPYFGHLRLEEELDGGKVRRRDVLIGARSYLDTSAGIRIVDWRHAPVSRLFYRYGEGEPYEEEMGDRLVSGCVVAKRSVAIVKGELLRVSAPVGTFVRDPSGRWRRTGVRHAKLVVEEKKRLGIGADGRLRQDKHLPAIAALLDPKQFELIAKPASGFVAIQGSAGSGKTTVGLHRVAYLAFAEPARFRPDRMLVVVPTDALLHYVGRVLPSLGVEGVQVTTWVRFARRAISVLFPKLPTKVNDRTPALVIRAKEHPAMLRGIDAVVQKIATQVEGQITSCIKQWDLPDVVRDAWKRAREGAPLDVGLALFSHWLGGKRSFAGVGDARVLSEAQRSALEKSISSARSLCRGVIGAWDELLTSEEGLSRTFEGVSGFGAAQLAEVREWCVKQSRIREEGERDGDAPTLDEEDCALILRLYQKLRGPLLDVHNKPVRFAHLFVDEVQDASAASLHVLTDLADAHRSITLSGDVAQRMLEEDDTTGGEFHWHDLLRDLSPSHTALEPLRVSYRSTAEITSFARKVLGPFAHEAEPIAERHGPPVELFPFSSPGEAVAFLADALRDLLRDAPDANVALIARFAPQADLYYEGLCRAEIAGVRRVAKQDFSWEPGVDVTDVRQTKGLEFDEVVLLETTASSYPDSAQARHALYVGATRASHQLWCIAGEAASKLVEGAL